MTYEGCEGKNMKWNTLWDKRFLLYFKKKLETIALFLNELLVNNFKYLCKTRL